jgi:hypothetical protein
VGRNAQRAGNRFTVSSQSHSDLILIRALTIRFEACRAKFIFVNFRIPAISSALRSPCLRGGFFGFRALSDPRLSAFISGMLLPLILGLFCLANC